MTASIRSAVAREHGALVETPLGVCGLAWTATGLSRVWFPDPEAGVTHQRLDRHGAIVPTGAPPEAISACIARLHAYFAGAPVDFADIVLDETGIGVFEAGVYRALRTVGRGTTTTYGALARRAGAPDAARAVGMAMGRNPWPIVVPCHRVLAAAMKPGGFSAPGGTASKLRLLRLEGVRLGDDTPLLPGLFADRID